MGDIFYIFQVIQACFAPAMRERIPLIYMWTCLAALWLQGVQSPAPAGKPHWVSVELGHALWLDMEFWLIQGMSIPNQYLPAEYYGHTLLSSHPLLSGFQFGFSWYCFHLLVSWVLQLAVPSSLTTTVFLTHDTGLCTTLEATSDGNLFQLR